MKSAIAQPPLLISRIGVLYLRMFQECDRNFRLQNLSLEMDQIPVLMTLYYKNGGLSQQDICSNLRRDKASVNRTVALLSKKDIVKVVQDTSDKRKTQVELTAAGKELAIRADAIVKKVDATLSAQLTEKEMQQFSTLINKLIDTSFT